jgi:hypothetical protein
VSGLKGSEHTATVREHGLYPPATAIVSNIPTNQMLSIVISVSVLQRAEEIRRMLDAGRPNRVGMSYLERPDPPLASTGRDLTRTGYGRRECPNDSYQNALPAAPGSVHPSTRRKAYDDGLPTPARSAKTHPGIRFNKHIEGDGPTVFAPACKMGLEGIVSKRKDSAYRSGRSPDWLKMKNLTCAAVRREMEEDGNR